MQVACRMLRGAGWAIALAAPLLFAAPVVGQTVGPTQSPASAPIATLDRERLFDESLQGKAIQSLFDADMAALLADNRKLEKALEEEEQQLTEQRATLAPEEFRKLAEAFDQKVEELRKAQDAKSRALSARIDADRQTFFEQAVPILGNLMAETGVAAILDRASIVLIFDKFDLTDEAIARIDAAYTARSTPGDAQGQAADPATAPANPQE